MTSAPIKITTADRILDASLKLFNEQGFHCVPAMRIAEHLAISPGHLAYHFKSKSDILIALFPRMDKALQETMHLEMPHVAPASIEKSLNLMKILWNYRFFFIELPQIAPIDSRILDSYLKLEERVLDTMRQSFDSRVAEGSMRPIPQPNNSLLLSKNVWVTWLDWIRGEQVRHPGQQTPCGASVYEAMLRGYCIMQPYCGTDYLDEVVAGLKKRLTAPAPKEAKPQAKAAGTPG
jgi:AcrR family transcriptional regulator